MRNGIKNKRPVILLSYIVTLLTFTSTWVVRTSRIPTFVTVGITGGNKPNLNTVRGVV